MEIAEIKEKLSIETVLAHYGIKTKNNHCCCPFHDDKTPSMQIYAETNTAYCFSSNCKLHGKSIDVIDFILHKEKLTKHQAILKSKELLNYSPPKTTTMNEIFRKLREAMPQASTSKAIKYLESRNINDAKLEVGFRATGNAILPNMVDCLIFPLKDKQGNVVSLYGRSIKSKNHYYQTGRSGLYPSYPQAETTQIVLTESVIDAITINKYTTYPVLALYGTNGLTNEHVQALQTLKNLGEIIFFLDGDEAGRSAVENYAKMLHDTLEVKVSEVETPEGEDVNSLVQSHEPEILNHLIEERKPLFTSNEKQNVILETQDAKLNTENEELPIYETDVLHITILGGISLHPLDKLKVTLLVKLKTAKSATQSLRQNLDLYDDNQVEKLIVKTTERLELGTREVQIQLANLIEAIEAYRFEKLESQRLEKPQKRILSKEREAKAIKFLQREDLLSKTNDLIGKAGVVGEEKNRLLMYLVFTSRLREQPLHIISLGASGTGKTYLQEKIAELIPEDQKLEITALSENALYYFDRTELKNKLVLIEDLDGANDDKVLFAIRELQSKKRISKTIPIKDAKGNLKTVTLQVEGPISLAGTTTREKLYEDNANRSLLIYLDNSQTHRDKIMNYQRNLSAGQINRTKEAQVKEFFKDVQSVLRPIKVRNPYAPQLIIPETVFKPLRTNAHYLNFIEVITFYKQYQRKTKRDELTGEEYIETQLEDIQEANELLKEILLAKSDELTKACRDFLESIKAQLKEHKKTSFYKSEVREWLKINPHNLKYYLSQLQQYGYLEVIGGNRYKQGLEYEVVDYDNYEALNGKIITALDKTLEKVKQVANVAS